jgi:elongator complex protein 1
MEPLRRQFTIDDDLARFKKALQSLYEMDAFEEIQKYAEKHELYSTAIELYKYKPERLNALMKLYADFLSSRNRFMEAGVAYEFLKDYASAIPVYKQAQRWREALTCATLVPVPEAELTDLAQNLAEGLIESKEYQSAATIYLEYLSNIADAARQLCKAYLFADAIRVVSLHSKLELLDSVINPGLIEGFTSTTELLADCKSQIQAQVPRLRELRLKKERDPLAFYTGDAAAGEAGADIPDNVSLAPTDATTSGGTFMTRYTGRTKGTLNTQTTRRTSKNRRREERKRARGKKGSVYEEEYLVNSIGRLIERVNNTGEEVARLVEGLVRRSMREQAVAVENAMMDVVGMCEVVVPVVWEAKKKDGEEENKAQGANAVFLDMVEGSGIKTPPAIKKFGRLSLIA